MPKLRLLPPVTTIYSQEQAAETLDFLMKRGGSIAIDTETNGLDKLRSRVLCWSMATENSRYYIPKEYLLFFDPLFQRTDITWLLANAKFDKHMLNNMGVDLHGDLWDIIVMDAMDDDTRAHGLKQQSHLAYGVRWGDFKDLFLDPVFVAKSLGLEKNSFTQFKKMSLGDKLMFVYDEKPEIVENYASCDAYFTYMRAMDLKDQLIATSLPTVMVPELNTLFDYFQILEVPFTKVLWDMEREGVPVDIDRVKAIDGPMRDGIRAKELILKEMAGPSYNPRSNDELRDILFSKQGFGLTPVSYTTSGKTPTASTAEKDLKILQSRVKDKKAFDFISAQLALRHVDKLHGTFIKGVKELLGPDGRIHSSLNQAGTRTARLSSSNPNLQNIPIRNDEFHIRSIFIAPDGENMHDYDYPQIQPRLAAVLSGCESMMEQIRNGWDIHSANAFSMYKHKIPELTYEMIKEAIAAKEAVKAKIPGARPLTDFEKTLLKCRDGAKTAGLGALFGEGKTKMAHQLDITVEEAHDLIRAFFDARPEIEAQIFQMHDYGHETETTHTMLGRIRRLHKINNQYNIGQQKSEERVAYNTLIQGSEMEAMKCAMLQIHHDKELRQMSFRLALSVHDELIGFSPKKYSKDADVRVKELMGDPFNWGPIQIKLPIPVDPDGAIGRDWASIH